MTVVHLLRHGEVDNPDRVLYGRLPGYFLSELGERQAAASAAWLAKRDIAYLVSSPLERAQQTAGALEALTGLPIRTDERLIEAANQLEGRQVAGGKGLLTDPSNWKFFRNPFRPVVGRAVRRDRGAGDRLPPARRVTPPSGREAVCVSHQLPIVIARRSAEGLRLFHDPRRRHVLAGIRHVPHFRR